MSLSTVLCQTSLRPSGPGTKFLPFPRSHDLFVPPFHSLEDDIVAEFKRPQIKLEYVGYG